MDIAASAEQNKPAAWYREKSVVIEDIEITFLVSNARSSYIKAFCTAIPVK